MPPRKKQNTEKNLANALASLEKDFGAGTVVKMGDTPLDIEVIPTEIAGIDLALGRGGLPKGRITEIYGPEASGKTSFTLRVIASAQKEGGKCAFIDAEHALDPEYAESLGVNTDELLLAQPDNGENALEIANRLIESREIAVIVIDSVAALTPKSEIEGEMGDANVGKQARMMAQGLRKMTHALSDTNTVLIFINQLREKIGVMFGSPETTTGGKSLKFYSSVRIDIRGSEKIKNGDDIVGSVAKIKIVKNKVGPPFKTAEIESYYGVGLSREESAITEAVKLGLIEKSGNWFEYEGEKHQGKTNFREYLEENPKVREKLYQEIMDAGLPKKQNLVVNAPPVAPEEEAEESEVEDIFD